MWKESIQGIQHENTTSKYEQGEERTNAKNPVGRS